MEKLEIQSPAFATGAPIPKEYTQQGSDMSPPLEIIQYPQRHAVSSAGVC